jgi:hypothetical protein
MGSENITFNLKSLSLFLPSHARERGGARAEPAPVMQPMDALVAPAPCGEEGRKQQLLTSCCRDGCFTYITAFELGSHGV